MTRRAGQLRPGERIRCPWHGEDVQLEIVRPHSSIPGWVNLWGKYTSDGREFTWTADGGKVFEVLS